MFERIKELRVERKVRQKEIAAYLHIAQGTYSDYENGKIGIPLETAVSIADFYDVSLDYMLGRKDTRD